MNRKEPFDDGNDFLKRHIGMPDQVDIKKTPTPVEIISI